MLYLGFSDYNDFRRLFGMEEHSNGTKSRKNKILLKHYKSQALHRWCHEHNDFTLLQIRSMADLKKTVLSYIKESGENDPSLEGKCFLMGQAFWSSNYKTDHKLGVCEDLDSRAVRYINIEQNKVFKMKAGKFMMSLIKETSIGKCLSESVVIWLGEEFTAEWNVYTGGLQPQFELHIDEDFEKIYDPYYCRDFNGCSCMVGKNRHSFYEECVKAKATYITDEDGYILARAILFTDVEDEDGKKWRLLERQYSRESDETYKRILIDQLIKAGEIDGYKQVGAGCGDARAFVDIEGHSLSHKEFTIDMDLETYDTLSYQDSFKWYDISERIAKNVDFGCYDYMLDTTDYSLDSEDEDDDREYDDFHDYSCDEVTTCYYHGREYSVDTENLSEFNWVESEDAYYHDDDVITCDECSKTVLKEKSVYSDLTDEWYCCKKCMEDAEDAYKRNNWTYASLDDEYVEDENDVETVYVWDEQHNKFYDETILVATLQVIIENNELVIDKNGCMYRLSKDKQFDNEHRTFEIAV